MPYTLWSHGRLLGESELDYARVFEKHRMGDFCPTVVGAKLMPVATGVSPAGIDLARMIRRSPQTSEKGKASPGWLERTLSKTSEYADFAAAQDPCDALALELRGPDNSVIPTEWIDVRDTEFLLSLARDNDRDDDAFGLPAFNEPDEPALGFEEGEEWREQATFPRYQIQVMAA